MPTAPSRPANPERRPGSRAKGVPPFLGLLDPVTLKERGDFEFDCALAHDDVAATWKWILRDLAADLIDEKALDESERSRAAVEALMPDLIGRAQLALDAAAKSPEAGRRLTSQVGGEETRDRLPYVLAAMRCRSLFEKAQGFGRAANGLTDDSSLTLALQSLVASDQNATPFLMFAMVGGTGLFVHLGTLFLGLTAFELPFPEAQALGAFVAMTSNFILNNFLTYRDQRLKGFAILRGLLAFYLVCSVGLFANVGVAFSVYDQEPIWGLAGAAGALMGVVWNYAMSGLFVWRKR